MLLYYIYPSLPIAKRFSFSRVPRVFLPLRVRFYFFTCIPHVISPLPGLFSTDCFLLASTTRHQATARHSTQLFARHYVYDTFTFTIRLR